MDEEELRHENKTLRGLVVRLSRVLGAGTEWNWCEGECCEEFGCNPGRDCPLQDTLEELGIIQDALDELRVMG